MKEDVVCEIEAKHDSCKNANWDLKLPNCQLVSLVTVMTVIRSHQDGMMISFVFNGADTFHQGVRLKREAALQVVRSVLYRSPLLPAGT